MKVCNSQSEYSFKVIPTPIKFCPNKSKLLKLGPSIHVGCVQCCLVCLSAAPALQAAHWHWLALTGSVLCLRSRLRAPSVPALSRLRLRPSDPALTLGSPHWHRLDTTGSMIISQLGFSRNCSVIILSCQQRISTISSSFTLSWNVLKLERLNQVR